MNWYLQSGNEADVAISTRIRLARNVNGFTFALKKDGERKKLEDKIKEAIFSVGYGLQFLKLKDMDDITKMSLVEKHLISPDFALNKNEIGSILINEEENICIMIGEEDHLRIQVFSSGLDLENTMNLAVELDEKLGNLLGYSISKKYGYLTSCPSNIGTGLRASVMLHLPALSMTGNDKKILESLSGIGVVVRGGYGENSELEGQIYQISNYQTLGISEKDIVQNLKVIVEQVMKQERQARKFLTRDAITLEDKIYRSYGILTNARKISTQETMKLLSMVKLGTDLGILPQMTDAKMKELYLYTKPANLQKYKQEQYEVIERDIKRAEVIKQIIEKN